MTESPGEQSAAGQPNRDELDLDKQAIKDLDIDEKDAEMVKGGAEHLTAGVKPPTTT